MRRTQTIYHESEIEITCVINGKEIMPVIGWNSETELDYVIP
jgi:ribosomal protein S27E